MLNSILKMRQTIDTLVTDNTLLTKIPNASRESLRLLENKQKSIINQIDEIRNNTQNVNEIVRLTNGLEMSAQNMADSYNELGITNQNIQKLRDDYKIQLETLNNIKNKIKAKNDELRNIEQSLSEIDNAGSVERRILQEQEDKLLEKRQIESMIISKSKKLEEISNTNIDLENDLEKIRTQMNTLNEKETENKKIKAELLTKHNELITSLSQQEHIMEDFDLRRNELSNKNKNLKDSILKKESEIEKLKNDIINSNSLTEEFDGTLKTQMDATQKLKFDLQKLNDEHDGYIKQIEANKDEYVQISTEHSNLLSTLNEVQGRIDEYSKRNIGVHQINTIISDLFEKIINKVKNEIITKEYLLTDLDDQRDDILTDVTLFLDSLKTATQQKSTNDAVEMAAPMPPPLRRPNIDARIVKPTPVIESEPMDEDILMDDEDVDMSEEAKIKNIETGVKRRKKLNMEPTTPSKQPTKKPKRLKLTSIPSTSESKQLENQEEKQESPTTSDFPPPETSPIKIPEKIIEPTPIKLSEMSDQSNFSVFNPPETEKTIERPTLNPEVEIQKKETPDIKEAWSFTPKDIEKYITGVVAYSDLNITITAENNEQLTMDEWSINISDLASLFRNQIKAGNISPELENSIKEIFAILQTVRTTVNISTEILYEINFMDDLDVNSENEITDQVIDYANFAGAVYVLFAIYRMFRKNMYITTEFTNYEANFTILMLIIGDFNKKYHIYIPKKIQDNLWPVLPGIRETRIQEVATGFIKSMMDTYVIQSDGLYAEVVEKATMREKEKKEKEKKEKEKKKNKFREGE